MRSAASVLAIAGRFARSANLERDITETAPLEGYIVTGRSLDAVQRLAATAATTPHGGAWSLTGPYGSGKSSLAVLLDGAFGESGPVRDAALSLIETADVGVGSLLTRAHDRHGTDERGFNRAVVTASREPISHTVLRALHSAVTRRFGGLPTASQFPAAKTLKAALSDMTSADPRRTGPSSASLLEIARELASDAPLLMVIDEFGKNLEAVDQSAETDPYLLQQLAEAGQTAGAPIFTLTLQHLSFEDYFAGSSDSQSLEWAKVQGRFEDIPFVDSASQTRALIGAVFEVTDDAMRRRVASQSERLARSLSKLGFEDLGRTDAVADCYPLHPLAAAVLPELCSRYGQNERTLFSFLTGPDPRAVPAFLESSPIAARGALPQVGLPEVYDYFVDGGLVTGVAGLTSSRWTEIATRLRDTHGLSDQQTSLAKAVALLNLVSTAGPLRASAEVLRLVDAGADELLGDLESSSLVTYRDFAGEYRIWQGSDIDLRSRVETAMSGADQLPLVEILAAVDVPQPVVAARHSAQNDVLRVFSRRYVTGSEPIEPISPLAEVDGEVLLVVGTEGPRPRRSAITGPAKPTVAAIPRSVAELDVAARSVHAVQTVLGQTDVAADWVARRELGEQLALADADMRAALVRTFAAENCDWFLVDDEGSKPLATGRGSAALSEAADYCYPDTPVIGNEMINRSHMTSQGAKARRLLLEAMIERTGQRDLGLEGFGPEVAMYRSMLGRSGLHRVDERNDTWVFAAPSAVSASLRSAWDALTAEFRRAKKHRVNLLDVHATLMSPPIGMKAAAVPVFVTAGLLANTDEVAIYEHGTFRPSLSAELSERMVRNPGHFDIKHYANASGARREVVDELASALGVAKRFRKHRVANVLAIVGHLVRIVGQLDNYTLSTRSLSRAAVAVRDALMTAVEPDNLLFQRLPEAVGLPDVKSSAMTYPEKRVLSQAVTDAISELETCHHALLADLLAELFEAASETSRRAISGQAAALEGEILDPEIRSFVLALASEVHEGDHEWVKAIATVVSQKAVSEWSDEDRLRFAAQLPLRIAAFQRLMALHLEHRAATASAYVVRRATFTSSDGREDHLLVALDESDRSVVEQAFGQAVRTVAESMGSEARARSALLALQGEHYLPVEVVADDSGMIGVAPDLKASND
ncbi:MAG: hypothetical protein OXP28_11910 [Gammaproteobacteria bacterium]|nr:hypothetical protein [Gammaproteobacteria bacterium]